MQPGQLQPRPRVVRLDRVGQQTRERGDMLFGRPPGPLDVPGRDVAVLAVLDEVRVGGGEVVLRHTSQRATVTV